MNMNIDMWGSHSPHGMYSRTRGSIFIVESNTGFVSGFQVLDAMLGYAGAVAALFAILNYLKMHDPALKSYIRTDDSQIRDNTPLTIIIASENTTNNPFHDLKLNVHIGTGPTGLTTIKSFETTLQLGPQGTMYNHLGYLEELRNMRFIEKDTEQRVNRDSEDPIVVSVHYSYRRLLFKRYISNYYSWNYKKIGGL